MRLYYHPESESYFVDTPGVWQNSADGALSEDVTDHPRHRAAASLDGVDTSDLDPVQEDDDFWAMPSDVEMPEIRKAAALGMSGAIAEAMRKWARKPADLYPTPTDCTYSLLPHIAHLLPANAKVWEPACADGQMVAPLREFGYNVTATDLRLDILGGKGGVDFIGEQRTPYHQQEYDAVITNPPFKIADQFIRRALDLAPVAVMLLKAQYWNTKNRKALFRETRPYMELNLTWRPAFLAQERGNNPLMDCMWVVWVRGYEGLPTVNMIDRLLECPVNYQAMDMGGL
jgi:hypothetical protein